MSPLHSADTWGSLEWRTRVSRSRICALSSICLDYKCTLEHNSGWSTAGAPALAGRSTNSLINHPPTQPPESTWTTPAQLRPGHHRCARTPCTAHELGQTRTRLRNRRRLHGEEAVAATLSRDYWVLYLIQLTWRLFISGRTVRVTRCFLRRRRSQNLTHFRSNIIAGRKHGTKSTWRQHITAYCTCSIHRIITSLPFSM